MSSRSRKRVVRKDYDQCMNQPTSGHGDGEIAKEMITFEMFSYMSFRSACILVFTLAIICFSNSVTGAFIFDDSEAIVGNKDLLPSTHILDLFRHDFWGNDISANSSHKSYRPLTVLTFRWNYFISDGLHPMGFHLVNVILHAVICVLLLKLYTIIFYNEKSSSTEDSLFAALVFAVHPVHTESVAGVVGRADLLCAVCFIISLIFYTRSCYRAGAKNNHQYLWLTLSMITTGLSVLCKEQGITVIGICSAYDILVVNEIDPFYPLSAYNKKIFPKTCDMVHNQWRRGLILRHIVLLVTGLVILLIRWRIMGSSTPSFQVVDNPHSFVDDLVLRGFNYSYLYFINAFILVLPIWLCFDWSMGCIPVIENYQDMRIFIVLLFWLCLGTLILLTLLSQPSKNKRLTCLSLAILLVTFLPASNIFFRVGFVIAERNLYLPSVGYAMLLNIGSALLLKVKSIRRFSLTGMMLVIIVMTARSVHRSSQWSDEMTLFRSGLTVCPLNAKVHYNLGKLYGDLNENEKAKDYYKTALRLNPTYDQAMNNLGNLYKESGNFHDGELWLTKAVTTRGDFAAAWMNLGIVQAALGKSDEAEKSYLTALIHRRRYPDCYYNLGNMYLERKQYTDALSAWRNATLQKPSHTSAWCNILILLDNLGRFDELDVVAMEALKQNPQEASIHYNYANSLGKKNRFQESEKHFLIAISLQTNNSNYHANLGVLYHRWKKYSQAEIEYKNALRLDPENYSAKDNMIMLMKVLGKK